MGLLVFCLHKSCRGFKHSYTFAFGSINDSDTGRKWLLKTFAVRFFGTSAEEERCPFVNTSKARHIDVILWSRSMSFWMYSFFGFFHKILLTLFLNFLHSRKHFSLFSLSLPLSLWPWCLVSLDVLPACALTVHVYWQQWDRLYSALRLRRFIVYKRLRLPTIQQEHIPCLVTDVWSMLLKVWTLSPTHSKLQHLLQGTQH